MRLALTHVHCWPEVRRGGERYLHELAGALARRGHAVTILSSASSPSRTVEEGVRVVRLRKPRGQGAKVSARFGSRVLPHLLRQRVDAVHALGPSDAAAGIVAERLGRVGRTVYTNLGMPERWWWNTQPDRRHHAFVLKHVDVYGCLSREAMRLLEVDYGRTGSLTPGGVRLDRFRPCARRAERPTILYSGTLDEPRKGVAILLEAVAELSRRRPDLMLWLCGQGDSARLLRAASVRAREHTEVLPVGTPDMARIYSQAWVTALPSRNEAFGLVLVESLACGTPVVGCNHAAIPELVSPNVGALAEPGDVASLVTALDRGLDLARDRDVVERCRAAAAPYDWETALAPRFEALYAG